MKSWKRALQEAPLVGSLASLASLAALMLGSRAEKDGPWASVNAPSHWLWGNRALRQDGASMRYTALGLLIHHLSASFWAVLHQKLAGTEERPESTPAVLGKAALTTAVAAWVDLRLVPHRLTPGFQCRLSPARLAGVYLLFWMGLAAGSHLAGRRRACRSGEEGQQPPSSGTGASRRPG